MRVLIVEDEKIASQKLKALIKNLDASIQIENCLETVEEVIQWLKEHEFPDLMFLDIQLGDGYCFDIFKEIRYDRPVIFTTAYNEYALQSFQLFSIDYLVKPIIESTLNIALEKYKRVIHTNNINYQSVFDVMKKHQPDDYKERFLIKTGQKFFFKKTDDVAYFKAEEKLVYLVDKEAHRYLVDYTLEKLEALLNPKLFFRLNRQVIVSIESISQIKSFTNNRLLLYLKKNLTPEEIIISRDRVAHFKEWAEQ